MSSAYISHNKIFAWLLPKGGYLDFSHLTELKNIYVTEIYMKKQYKSSIIRNHKITKKKNIYIKNRGMVFP